MKFHLVKVLQHQTEEGISTPFHGTFKYHLGRSSIWGWLPWDFGTPIEWNCPLIAVSMHYLSTSRSFLHIYILFYSVLYFSFLYFNYCTILCLIFSFLIFFLNILYEHCWRNREDFAAISSFSVVVTPVSQNKPTQIFIPSVPTLQRGSPNTIWVAPHLCPQVMQVPGVFSGYSASETGAAFDTPAQR